jgi:hypothetical protein
MRQTSLVLVILASLALAAAASAADTADKTPFYNETSASLKLNEGAYGQMAELKGNFWVWCKEGYDITADPELTAGKFTHTAINATFAPEAQTQQMGSAKAALGKFLPAAKFAYKESGGKHAMDVAIVRNELNIAAGVWSAGAGSWTYAAETKVTDESGNVLFRGLFKIQDTSWQAAPNKWAKDFGEIVAKFSKKLAKGFGEK